MKREKFLWPLTQSHHRALLAARRVREGLSAGPEGEPERLRQLSAEVQKLFTEELRRHFWDEERILSLFEQRMGPDEPEPQKLRREHRLLESLGARTDREGLLAFAELLVSHVRFEEDVLFGRIEKALDEGTKKTVEDFLPKAPAS